MLTKQQAIHRFSSTGYRRRLDRPSIERLAMFLTIEEMRPFDLLVADESSWQPLPWTEEQIKEQLKEDLDFAFTKALAKLELSANFMAIVIRMWMTILEDPLKDSMDELYPQYGLPYLKAVAIKYNLPNPIGDDLGTESKYEMESV